MIVGALSIRELNSNISRALARVEAGETLDITRNGKIIAELKPKRRRRSDDPQWRKSFEELMAFLDRGAALGGPAAYDERTT